MTEHGLRQRAMANGSESCPGMVNLHRLRRVPLFGTSTCGITVEPSQITAERSFCCSS